MSLLLTACSESFDDWAAPQANGQEDALTVIVDVKAVDPIDFANVESETTQVFSVDYTIPEDATASTKAYFYNADRTDSVEVESTADVPFRELPVDLPLYAVYVILRDVPEIYQSRIELEPLRCGIVLH